MIGETLSVQANKQELWRVSHQAYESGTLHRPAESLAPPMADDSKASSNITSEHEIETLKSRIEELERELLALEESLVLKTGPRVRKTIPRTVVFFVTLIAILLGSFEIGRYVTGEREGALVYWVAGWLSSATSFFYIYIVDMVIKDDSSYFRHRGRRRTSE